MYYKLAFRKKRTHHIALVVGLIFVMMLIGFAVMIRNMQVPKPAAVHTTLSTYELGNISAHGASVFWQTKEARESYVKYGKDPSRLDTMQLDERDLDNHLSQRTNHFVQLSGLDANTTYYFQFYTGNQVVGKENVVYQLLTTLPKQTTSNLSPLFGKILGQHDQPLSDAIVILKSERTAPLIALSKADGTFLFSLCCMVDRQSRPISSLSNTENIVITVLDSEGDSLEYKAVLSDIMGQTITLAVQAGSNKIDERKEMADTQQVQGEPTGEPKTVLGVSAKDARFSLLYPKDGALIPGNQPLFKGTAPAGSTISLSVAQKQKTKNKDFPLQATIQTDSRGVWIYTPPTLFLPDQYTVTSFDTAHKASKIQRTFSIAKSGEAVLGDATASATLTPTVPVLTDTPTPATDSSVTATPAATITPRPTAPVTGFDMAPLVVLSTVLMVIGAGFLLVF